MDKKELRLRRSARKDSIKIEKLANEYNFQIVSRYFEDIEYDEEFTKIAVDKEGNVIGGCIGEIYAWGVLYVDTLWVDEKYRGKDIGSNLIKAVEDVGREKGCYLCFVGTLDVQARPFYEKQGYKLFGTMKDTPKGHEDYGLYKQLDVETSSKKCKKIDYEIKDGNEEQSEYVDDKLEEYNLTKIPNSKHDYIKINRKFVDKDGKLVAGIMAGVSSWDIGWVWTIWVEEPYRNNGLGSALLSHFEKQAKAKGATVVEIVSVFDWQIDFFLKNGYEIGQKLDNFPKGHTFYVIKKDL